MYSLKISKYKHTYNNNYFDNTFPLSNDTYSNIVCLQLNGLPAIEKLYYHIYTSGSFLIFKLYSDSARTLLIAGGSQSMNLLLFSTYANMQISGAGIDGQMTFKLVDGNPFPELLGYIETNTGLVDYITISDLPTDFISSLSEELINENNEYTVSDYRINLTNLTTQTSNLGLNVFDFFENEDVYIYRVLFAKDDVNLRVGFLDYSSMNKNLNNDDSGSMISFTVFSAEKEMSDFMNNLIFTQIGYKVGNEYSETFNEILSKITYTVNCNLIDNIGIDNLFYSEYGYYPQTDFKFVKPLETEKLKDIFVGLLKQLGIMFKIVPDNLEVNTYSKPFLKFFFRDGESVLSDIQVIEEIEGNKGIDMINKYWACKNLEIDTNDNVLYADTLIDMVISGGSNDPPGTSQNGFINLHQAYTIYNGTIWKSRWLGVNAKTYLNSSIKFIEVPMYDCNISYYGDDIWTIRKTTPVRMFEKYYDNNYWCEILNFCNRKYDYLLTNIKKTKTLKIVLTDLFDITLYNQVFYDNKYWYIEKISNIDIINEQIKIEVTEL